MLTQVEGIVNYRPITRVSADPRDMEALSPMQIWCPGVTITTSANVLPPGPVEGEVLRKAFQRARAKVDAFWKAWSRDYLSTLRDRKKWNNTREDIKVGQLVMLEDESKHREGWKLGRVVTVTGDETHGRTVEVWTGKKKVFKRDVTKVVPLEVE